MANKALDTVERKRRGARLAEFRGWLGLTQAELAEWITGVTSSKSLITHAEQGTRPVPVEKLNETFGVSWDWLMGYEDEEMWGPTVQAIRRRLALWLKHLSPEQNQTMMHPGARIAASFKEIQKFTHLLTDRYAAAILNIDLPQWHEVLADETYVSPEQWQRWAQWTDLPERWVGKGELPPQPSECERFDEYVPAFREAVRLGIPPEKLLAIVQALGT